VAPVSLPWLNGVLANNHPAVFLAASADPTGKLVDYGALGIFAALSIYAIKKMYDAITASYNDRLADKDAIIANRDATIAKQDTIISMFLHQGQQAVPALQRTAQVIEAQAAAAPPAGLAEVGEFLQRAEQVLSRLESKAVGGEGP
jgi:hypothetical protein